MFSHFRIILISTIISTFAFADLFISEYAEGTSNNKYLEIYNSGSSDILLDDYGLAVAFNGTTTGEHEGWRTFTAGAMVASGDVYLFCHSSIDDDMSPLCDQLTNNASWSGNDAVCLALGTNDSHTLLDCIGDFGPDPGSGWDACGQSAATKDYTLVRKSSVQSGNSDWSVTAGTDDTDCQWLVEQKPSASYQPSSMGNHTMAPTGDVTCNDETACNNGASEACTYAADACTDCDGNDLGGQDNCGVCGGDDTTCADCCGVPNGNGSTCDGVCGACNDATSCLDCCDVVNGNGTTCDGVCGACNDATSCLDCEGTVNGTATFDSYGLCGGDGTAVANLFYSEYLESGSNKY